MSRKPPWVHSRKTNSRYAGMSVPYTTCAATQPVSPGFVPSDTDRNYHLPAPFPAKDGMIPAYPCKAKKLPAVPNVPPGTNEASGSIRLYRPYSKYFLSHWRLRDMKPVTGTSHVTQLAKSYTPANGMFHYMGIEQQHIKRGRRYCYLTTG